MNRDQQSLFDIADSISLIFEYVQVIEWSQFENSLRDQDAVIRRLTIIGEATKRLSNQFRDDHPEIPWKKMAGLRDVVVHEYDEINLDVLKEIIDVNLPEVFRLYSHCYLNREIRYISRTIKTNVWVEAIFSIFLNARDEIKRTFISFTRDNKSFMQL